MTKRPSLVRSDFGCFRTEKQTLEDFYVFDFGGIRFSDIHCDINYNTNQIYQVMSLISPSHELVFVGN